MQRPRNSQVQVSQISHVSQQDSEIEKQVAFLVDREALNVIPPLFREVILGIIGSDITIQFGRLQREAAEKRIKDLPFNTDLGDPKNFQFVKDMRLVWRFWTDFVTYCEEIKQ